MHVTSHLSQCWNSHIFVIIQALQIISFNNNNNVLYNIICCYLQFLPIIKLTMKETLL